MPIYTYDLIDTTGRGSTELADLRACAHKGLELYFG
jgi:hypothetical protein